MTAEEIEITTKNAENEYAWGDIVSIKIDGRKIPKWLLQYFKNHNIETTNTRVGADWNSVRPTHELHADFSVFTKHFKINKISPVPPKPKTFKQMFEQDYWWRGSGRWYVINEMDKSHLDNTLNFLNKNCQKYGIRVAAEILREAPSSFTDIESASDGVFNADAAMQGEANWWSTQPLRKITSSKMYTRMVDRYRELRDS